MVRKILLIDDLRDFKLISDDTTIVVARSSEEALNILREHHDWDEIWLDHDLGTVDGVEDTIMPVVDYLVEYTHTHKGERVGRRFFIHSSNPAGVENIKRALATVGIPAFKISGNISLTAER